MSRRRSMSKKQSIGFQKRLDDESCHRIQTLIGEVNRPRYQPAYQPPRSDSRQSHFGDWAKKDHSDWSEDCVVMSKQEWKW